MYLYTYCNSNGSHSNLNHFTFNKGRKGDIHLRFIIFYHCESMISFGIEYFQLTTCKIIMVFYCFHFERIPFSRPNIGKVTV